MLPFCPEAAYAFSFDQPSEAALARHRQADIVAMEDVLDTVSSLGDAQDAMSELLGEEGIGNEEDFLAMDLNGHPEEPCVFAKSRFKAKSSFLWLFAAL